MAQSYPKIGEDVVQVFLSKRFGFLPSAFKGHGAGCACGSCLISMSERFVVLEHQARELRAELGLPFRKLHRAMQIWDLEAEVHACAEVLVKGSIHVDSFLYGHAVRTALARRAERISA